MALRTLSFDNCAYGFVEFMRKTLVLAVALLLPACREEKYHYSPTPNGLMLSWQNVGAVPGWYPLSEVGLKLEGAVEDAVVYLAKYAAPPELVRAMGRNHKYIGWDAARFAISASETGYASGAWFPGSKTIMLAFWSRTKGNVVPADAPPWTVYSWPSRPDPAYDWGYEPPAFPAMGHELGHGIWGAQFEHGWTPPVVGGASLLATGAQPEDWRDRCVIMYE